MPVTDQTAALRAKIAAALEKVSLGEDIGFDVTWAVVQTLTGQHVGYSLLFTMPSPLLGKDPLFITTGAEGCAPHLLDQDTADRICGEAVRILRERRSAALSKVN